MPEKFHCLVNRKRRIRTLQDKDLCNGYRWDHPDISEIGTKDCVFRGKKTGFTVVSAVKIADFDGVLKLTIETQSFYLDGTERIKPYIGTHVSYLAGRFHGRNSGNWKREFLTLEEIIAVLDTGFSIVPGKFKPATRAVSQRAANMFLETDLVFYDCDEWTADHPAVPPEELYTRYPQFRQDFYWIGESISSRSMLKSEWRYRILMRLPELITGDPCLWNAKSDFIIGRYPFVAAGSSKDVVRVSYGNGRENHFTAVLGGVLSPKSYSLIKSDADAKRETVRVASLEKLEADKRRAHRRDMKAQYSVDSRPDHPWTVFTSKTVAEYLIEHNWASNLQGEAWNWHESGPGKSLELTDAGVIKPFSETVQRSSPEKAGVPVNGYRFIAYNLFGLDVTKESERNDLYRQLAQAGYGSFAEESKEFKKTDRQTTIEGVRAGVVNPLSIQRPPPILAETDDPPSKFVAWTENYETILDAFDIETRIMLLRADTGVGKDHAKVNYILESGDRGFIESAPTSALCIEKEQDFVHRQREGDNHLQEVFRWRGLMSGWKQSRERPYYDRIAAPFIGESPCIQAPLFKALRVKGATPQKVLCPRCPVEAACRTEGYLSQIHRARDATYILTPHRDLFFHPGLKGFVDRLIETKNAPVAIVDELKVYELFIENEISRSELLSWRQMWQGTPTADFADQLLAALGRDDLAAVRAVVEGLTERQRGSIIRAFTHIRFCGEIIRCGLTSRTTGRVLATEQFCFDDGRKAWVATNDACYDELMDLKRDPGRLEEGVLVIRRGAIDRQFETADLTPDEAIASGVYPLENLSNFGDPAQVDGFHRAYKKGWSLLEQLELFLTAYPRNSDAPAVYQSEIFRFYCPPQLHPQVKYLIMMSATLQTEVIKEKIFPGIAVKIVDVPSTAWADRVEVFQVRTGRYPRQSVLKFENGKATGFRSFGKRALFMFLSEAKRTPEKTHGLITYKVALDLMAPALTRLSNVVTGNYGAAEGENEKYAAVDVLWVLFAQVLPEHEVIRRAKIIYGRDEQALNYDRTADGNFVDDRLQAVDNAAIQAELIQAVGRARLVRREGVKVVILTAVDITGISQRAATVFFDYADYEIAGALDNLKETVDKRRAHEMLPARAKELHNQGYSTRAIADILNVSYRHARKIID